MSALMPRAEEAREIAEVNVVPLADVSLVLLIILLVLSPMMRQAMLHVKSAAKSAKAETATPEELLVPKAPEIVLVVGLNPDGMVLGDKHFAGFPDLSVFLQTELARRTDKKVFLSPHPEVPVGQVVQALEAIKGCGAESVALVQTQEAAPLVPAPIDGQVPAAAPAP